MIQIRLPTIQPRDRVPQPSDISGRPHRPAHAVQHEIRRRVVAPRDRRLADFRERHPLTAHMLARDRRIRQHLVLRNHHAPRKLFLARIHLRQQRSDRQHLERATHRKHLVHPDALHSVRLHIQHRHPEPSAARLLNPRQFGNKLIRRRFCRPHRNRAKPHRAETQNERSSRHRMKSPPSLNILQHK